MTTTPTTGFETKFTELEAKYNSLQSQVDAKHDALQSQVDALTKQIEAFNINREDIGIKQEPLEKAVEKPAKKPAKKTAKKELSTPEFPLPWTGVPIQCCCQGIRSNYETYTQCHHAPDKDSKYCKACSKKCDDTGIPKDGDVNLRNEITKKAKPYIHYMNAKKLSQKQVIEEANKFGITLSDDIFEKPPTTGKGRPKRVATANDSDEEPLQSADIQIVGLLTTEPTSPSSA